MEPYNTTLEPHTEGTTWQGIPTIGPVTFIAGDAPAVPPSAPLDEMWCQIRRGSTTGALLATFRNSSNTGELPIVVADAVSWEASIPMVAPADFPATPGTYYWSLHAKDTDGVVWPLYAGTFECRAVPTKFSEMETVSVPAP